ncbi:hypothetical protein HPB52_014191 [Rhipicephalus sanguineus]|uniref:Uncharacterized protein n=1 Tax=Rhipicephalus sanguineus TaxID=34632 RepID=A0A9D4QAC5_RHISA|nr:hypothetical protein HPB52_014191 [Rhipicephalus sanguineus]
MTSMQTICAQVDDAIAAMKAVFCWSPRFGRRRDKPPAKLKPKARAPPADAARARRPRGAKQPSDPTKIMRSALRVLKLRLDRVGRKLSELDFDNRVLENERIKVRNSPDRSSGAGPSSAHGGATSTSPTGASSSAGAILSGERGSPSGVANSNGICPTPVEREPWPLCPSAPGRSSLLADMMTPSTSSASLDAILGPRRQLRKMQQEQQEQHPVIALASTVSPPVPPPRLALPPPIPATMPVFTFGQPQRSNTSFPDASEDPLFLFTDLFEDTSDESVNNNLSITRQGTRTSSTSLMRHR